MNLPTLILSTLKTSKRKAITGYDLTKIVNDLKLFLWQSSHQQVYRELGKLEAAGLVTHTLVPQSGKPDRKDYELTKKGRKHLAEQAMDLIKLPPIRDQLAVQIIASESHSLLATQELLMDYVDKKEMHISEMISKKDAYEDNWIMSSLLERQIQVAEIDVAWIKKIINATKSRIAA